MANRTLVRNKKADNQKNVFCIGGAKTNHSKQGRNKMRLKKRFFIVILFCLIASCSLVKTTYNNAPELTSWWLDNYFDFTQAQKSVLTPALHRLHQWHRQDQLPIYITLLQDMQTSLANEQISASQACNQIDAIKLSLRTIQTESIPIIVEMAPLLSDEQLKYFKVKLQKRAEKWKSEWYQETAEEQIEVRLEKIEDFADKVYGTLNDTQRSLLKQSLAQSTINPAINYVEILRRNEDAFQTLGALQNQSFNLKEKSHLVAESFKRLQQSPNPTYQDYDDNIAQQSCETISQFHATTSAKQKLHAKHWLQDYINKINELKV